MDTIANIVKHNYSATPAQVMHLAALVAGGATADGTYLRILLAHTQGKLPAPTPGRRPRSFAATSLAALDEVHADLYAHVLKGVGPEDVPAAERTRRATFARTAASTVRAFIHGGGDVRAVEVAAATKGSLRRAIAPSTVTGATRAERAMSRTLGVLDRVAQRLARSDPDAARGQLEAARDHLSELLDKLDEAPREAAPATTARQARTPRGHRRPPAPAVQRQHA